MGGHGFKPQPGQKGKTVKSLAVATLLGAQHLKGLVQQTWWDTKMEYCTRLMGCEPRLVAGANVESVTRGFYVVVLSNSVIIVKRLRLFAL